jgi:hypothetical protein
MVNVLLIYNYVGFFFFFLCILNDIIVFICLVFLYSGLDAMGGGVRSYSAVCSRQNLIFYSFWIVR